MRRKINKGFWIYVTIFSFLLIIGSGGCKKAGEVGEIPESGEEEALSITSTSIGEDTNDVAVTAPLSIVFNKSLTQDEVNNLFITLTRADDVSVSGDVSYDDSTKTATFAPNFPLLNDVEYKADVKMGAMTVGESISAGKAVVIERSWVFRTVPRPILFSSNRDVNNPDDPNSLIDTRTKNIWRINADGTGLSPVTTKLAINTESSNAIWTPDGTKIVLFAKWNLDGRDATNINQTGNIWVMNADGSSPRPLTNLTHDRADTSPYFDISPDGKKVAYASRRALDKSDAPNSRERYNIWVVDIETGENQPLTRFENVDAYWPRWSPDGTKILFSSPHVFDITRDAPLPRWGFNVWVMNADGSDPQPVTRQTYGANGAMWPLWSHDGTKILYLSDRSMSDPVVAGTPGYYNIWISNPDGTQAPLTTFSGPPNVTGAKWSPDGSKIIYEQFEYRHPADNISSLKIMNSDGSDPRTLIELRNTYTQNPHWKQDGRKVTYISPRLLDGTDASYPLSEERINLWIVDVESADTVPLTRADIAGAMNNEAWW